MALMSGKVYSNTGTPSNADGVDGDIYLRLDGMKTTYRKESGAWVAVGSTLGAIPEIISGVGAPSNALGADEQYYRDTSNQNIYYKQGSMWNIVGSLAAASLKAILDQSGIGRDLELLPNLIDGGSLNSITTVGEYYYINNVTDTPAPYGLMKVWRKNFIYIYQLVQSSGYNGKLYNRYTEDGGATWGPWVEYANVGGNAGQRFKVANAVDDQDATAKLQVETMIANALVPTVSPQAYGRFKNVAPYPEIQYFDSTLLTYQAVRNSSGWEIIFFQDLTSADYIVVGNVTGGGGGGGRSFEPYDQTLRGFKIKSAWGGDNTVGYSTDDGAEVNFVVF